MKTELSKWLGRVVMMALAGGLLSGCAWSIGSDKQGTAVTKPTRGQELVDLKKALNDGAITQEEYDAQKKKILGN
jgi:hypothetical protein